LRKAGIPVAGADRLKLMENIAVLDLLALARFCLLEEDDYSLACLLKSPLLTKPFSEEQLFEVGWGRGRHSLWKAMQLRSSVHCADAVQQLSAWREEAQRTRPYEFFTSVLGSARRRILMRLGGEAKDALDAFLGAALDYEMNHSSSLQAFIQWFSSGDIEIKRNMEQVSGEVRIMTVHGAKGLEAPIVILPDTASIPDGRNESPLMSIATGSGAKLPLWRLPRQFESPGVALALAAQKDARAHEYRRLLYVAMTRAQDELYLCGYRSRNNPPIDCWHNLVAPAVLPMMRAIGDGSGWRLGADPVFVEEKPEPLRTADIPAWTFTVARQDELRSWTWPSYFGAPGQVPRQQLPSQQRGVLIHRILELLPDVPPAKRGEFIRAMARRGGTDEGAVTGLLTLLERPELVHLLGGDGLSEVPIVAEIKELGSISGRVDRVIVRPDEILLVDYKTDEDWPQMDDRVKPEYLLQMAAYRAAFRDVYPGMHVRCGLLWTSAPQFMELPDALLDEALASQSCASALTGQGADPTFPFRIA
jgi:ATP-dependent helicase/nuclease subunit A